MSDTTQPVPAIFASMNAIMLALSKSGIAKGRQNTQQGYNFRGIDEVYNEVSGLLAEHKVLVEPRYSNRVVAERTTKKGDPLFNVTVEGSYTFRSAVDGSHIDVGPFFGEAMDTADKATNKAMSASMKYAVIQTLVIPTKGDNDADATTHEPEARALNEAELTALRAQLTELKINEQLFCQSTKIEKLEDILVTDMPGLQQLLDKKRKKAATKAEPKAANDPQANAAQGGK
jgi:hypothetical protein